MTQLRLTQAVSAHHHLKHPGGRLIKIGGQAVSLAPQLGQAFASLSASVSRIALSATLALVGTAGASYAACVETSPGLWDCTGTLATTQMLSPPAGGALDVTTASGFGISTSAGNAFTLSNNIGDLGLTFTDDNASSITGSDTGINARNNGSGALSVTTTGDVTGTTYDGINAHNESEGLAISAAAVSGGRYGIDGFLRSGALSVTSTGDVTGTSNTGIEAQVSSAGTNLTVEATNVSGGEYGVHARNYGSGTMFVTTTGNVTGANEHGISTRNYGTDTTIAAAAVSGGDVGIYAGNLGSGALSVTTTGDVTATGGGYWGGVGIYARNFTSTTDLTIDAASVSGDESGIRGRNNGSGALSVTATGDVTGTSKSGIVANNEGTDLTINAAGVSGGASGINASNRGSGALSVTATGDVETIPLNILTRDRALNAINWGTDLTIEAARVSGQKYGISADNRGTGALSVTATGDVTATGIGFGIYARNSGTDLTIEAARVSSVGLGIIANNIGTGALSVSATGDVTGTNYTGIDATNTGTDLTIEAASVSGGKYGISAVNRGTGALSVSATGTVTATTGPGISTLNDGTDLTIEAASVSGEKYGIKAFNDGTGDVSVTVSGDVTATHNTICGYCGPGYRNTGAGITAAVNGSGALSITVTGKVLTRPTYSSGINAIVSSSSGTDLTINSAAVSGRIYGIYAQNYGSGDLSITSTGDVSSDTLVGNGIYASNSGANLTIDVTGVIAGQKGIYALNNGTGALSVAATGAVIAYGDHGIVAINNGTDLSIDVMGVTGGKYGISAINNGSGATDVTVGGVVKGGTQAGIQVLASAGSTATITLNAGANVSSDSGVALSNNESDTVTTLNLGSSVTGIVQLADGSDELLLVGGDVSGVTLFDGGDDSSTADGFIDTVRVTGMGYDVSGSSFSNWEVFSVEGGSVTFNDTALTIGDGSSETGVSIFSGGVLRTGANFTLNAPLGTSSGGIFDASGGGGGTVTINGDVSNDGILFAQDGTAGDVITIAGDYSGSGIVALDTVLNDDASATDVLVIQGTASGAGVLDIANAGGGGDVTVLGIDVITVAGASAGQFTLAGDYVTEGGDQAIVAGAYAYTLAQVDNGGWRLQSEAVPVDPPVDPVDPPAGPRYQPGAPIYESYAQSLLALNGTHSLRNRGSSLNYRQTSSAAGSAPVQRAGSLASQTPSPFWIQLGYDNINWAPDASTTGATSDSNVWELEAGADLILNEGATGYLVGGVILNYVTSGTDVSSEFGTGSIDTTGMGVALAATWYDERGFYVDGQLKYSRYDSDLSSASLGALSRGNDGSGYALSIEAGQEYRLESGFTLIPQAQLTRSSVEFDDFTGPSGERVSLGDADSLVLRLGLEVDQYKTLEKGEQRLYGIVNLFHEFNEGTNLDVSGVSLANSVDNWAAEIGLGGSYTWDDTYSIYGEASYATGLGNVGDSQKISANLGFRFEF